MTCIVAVSTGSAIHMGGDSAGVDSALAIQIRQEPKVFAKGKFLIGGSGSFRMLNLLRYKFDPPPHDPDDQDDHEYMVSEFVERVRFVFQEHGYASKEDNVESMDGEFLVGYRGNIYVVCEDFQVGVISDGYAACGSGTEIALGSLFSTVGQPPRKRLAVALEAAERFNAGVRGPFTYVSSKTTQ